MHSDDPTEFDDYDSLMNDLPEPEIPDEEEPNDKFRTVEKTTSHPLEEVFEIEEGTTIVEYEERVETQLVKHETYDDKDNELEQQIQEVFDVAMEAFENASEDAQDVEPQYRARNQEVAAQYLRMALDAANSKANMKQNKDKLEKMVAKQNGGQQTNNIIVDRNELLKALNASDEAVDAEYSEVKDESDE